MPYAANDRVSDDEFEGSIYISKPAMKRAIEAMTEGKRVVVSGSTMKFVEPEAPPEPEPPSAEELRAQSIQAVKQEAQRRIFAILSDIEQRNALAAQQAAILTFGADMSKWPENERQQGAQTLAQWAEIERIRAASNRIEAMETIPDDLSANSLWE